MEADILLEAVSRAAGEKTCAALDLVAEGRPVTAVADAIGISRQPLSAMHTGYRPNYAGDRRRRMVADIRMLVADLPTYGYRRVHALLRRQNPADRTRSAQSKASTVMKAHGLLLQPHSGKGEERRNTRWCSDALEISCDNGSPYVAGDTRRFAHDIGLVPRTTWSAARSRTAWQRRSSAPSSATTSA